MIKKIKKVFVVILILQCETLFSQLSGVYNIPADFSTLGVAISNLNTLGISGGVTINIPAGYSETVSIGGYSLTATGSALNPIIFKKSGAGTNPILTAYTGGTATPASLIQDGIWSLIGSDYVTIDGIDLLDPNSTNNSSMEYGYGLFKTSGTDGCNNVTIKNCTVTLNRVNNTPGLGASDDGSRGINIVNATMSAQTNSLTVTSASGSNSNNKFYNLKIQNCNIGISIIGYTDVPPYTFSDSGNDIGGPTAPTTNIIVDYGGGGGVSPAAGVHTKDQQNLNVSHNQINNNTGVGINHTTTLRGIYVESSNEANVTIDNNVISIKFGGTSAQVSVIENKSGSAGLTNTVEISNNNIVSCTNAIATSGTFYGIYNNGASPANLFINNNVFTSNTTNATGGSVYLIHNSGAVTKSLTIQFNSLGYGYTGAFANTGSCFPIYNINGTNTTTLNISLNTFSGFTFSTPATGPLFFIYNTGNSDCFFLNNNTWNNLILNHLGFQRLILNQGYIQHLNTISSNSISLGYTRNSSSGNTYLIETSALVGPACTQTISNNNLVNVVNNGTTTGVFEGIICTDYCGTLTVNPRKTVFNNVLSNITYSTTSGVFLYLLNGMGDANTGTASAVYNNVASNVSSFGDLLGFWILQNMGPNTPLSLSSNTINNLYSYTTTTSNNPRVYGIYSNEQLSGINISSNKIYSLTANGYASIVDGIYLSSTSKTTIYNNVIGRLETPYGYGTNVVNGIYLACTSGSVELYYNTVCLSATSNQLNFTTNALFSTSFANLLMKNNIFVNNSTPNGVGSSNAFKNEWGVMSTYNPASNNNIFYAGLAGPNHFLLYNLASTYATIPALKAAVYPRESLSATENVSFASLVGSNPLFLHINLSAFSLIDNNALIIPGIKTDIDPDIRFGNAGYLGAGTAPDIGADEYDPNIPNCSSANAGFITALSTTVCAGQPVILNSSGSSAFANTAFEWKISNVSSGPYSNVTGGTGANTPGYVSAPMTTGTYYYVFTNTCLTNSQTQTSNQLTITVYPTPSASASAVNSLVCSGNNLNLFGTSTNTVSGTSFSWTGPKFFTSTLQNPTINNPTLDRSGNYTFIISTSLGCSDTALIYVDVKQAPTNLTFSPTNTTICNSGSVSVIATGGSVTTLYTIGTQTIENIYNEHLSPYTAYTAGQRMQMMVLATELTTAGILPNTPITSIQFPVNSRGLYWNTSVFANTGCQALAVKIGTTALSNLNTLTFQNGLTTIVSPANFLPIVGNNNTHIFSSPFIWDGVNNVIVEVTFSNNNSINYPEEGAVYQNQTIFSNTMTIVYGNNNMTPAAIAAASSVNNYYAARPNFKLNGLASGTYTWSPPTALSATSGPTVIASPTISSIYTVMVNDGNCISNTISTINVANVPTLNVTSSASLVCSGQPATLSVNGASSYSWNTSATTSTIVVNPIVNTAYSVNGTNAPCLPSTASVQIMVNPLPTVPIVFTPTAICVGGSATVSATGANSYSWNTSSTNSFIIISPTTNTLYSVTGTDSQSCQATVSGTFLVNTLPNVVAVTLNSVICIGQAAILAAGGANSYSWNTSATTSTITDTPTITTTYTVTGTNTNSCAKTVTVTQQVSTCTSISGKNFQQIDAILYPNPNAGEFYLQINALLENIRIEIYNEIGQLILVLKPESERSNINIKKFANGVYLIRVIDGADLLKQEKILKE